MLSSDIFKTGSVAANSSLSRRGKKVLGDVKDILHRLIVLGVEKNGDDRLQDLFWQMHNMEEVPLTMNMQVDPIVSVGFETEATKLTEAGSRQEVKQDLRKFVSSVQSLLSLLITSSAFRLIISDILVTTRDILADVAMDVAKVAAVVEIRAEQLEETVRPGDAELAAQRDEEGGVGIPSLESLAQSGETVRNIAAKATQSTVEEAEARRRAIWTRLEDQDPDRVKETVLLRIRQVIEQAQTSPQYTAALMTMASLCRKYIDKAAYMAETISAATTSAASNAGASVRIDPNIDVDPHLIQALKDFKVLLERFSGHGTDLLLQRLVNLAEHISSEKEDGDGSLQNLLNAVSKWLNRCLNQPGWIATDEGQTEGSRLYDWSAEILKRDPKYKEDARSVLEEVYALRDGLANDTTTSSVLAAIQTLVNDLTVMGQVRIQVATVESSKQWEAAKAELWKDILSWVLPRVLQAIQTIPLPRVELKSDKLDMVIDKVTLASPSFIPDHIQVTNHTEFILRASSAVRNEDRFYRSSTTTRTRVVVDGLRISIEDIAYYLNAKGPFWSGWLDNGLLTIDVGGKQVIGDGISLMFDVEVPSLEDRSSGDYLFKVLDAKVDVPGLAFQMKQTRHWIFNTLVTQPLLGPLVRTATSLILSAQIKRALESLNSSLCDLRAKAQRVTGKHTNELKFMDYWEAITHHQEPAPSHTASVRSQSPTTVEQEPHTHVETETTTKGIIRTTVVEDAEGEPQSETVLAIGIGEQILPGLGGPTPEQPPTLVEQTRKALDELDEARREARDTAKTAIQDVRHATEDVRQRKASAEERIPDKKAKLSKVPDWRSSNFDI